ncbi:SDR family oxidoreductase [Pseudomonas sp. BN414]|uniref:SDR family NAD(P)-dependent oxidoreductase n=1 Tax=Pseudomonas TaxID=286 RepID=UPI0015C0186B|nr:SDR family oxidoreductase [Pseudomonas sp. BN414]MDH4565619.1 SDR family oxidoreductase [Pseudomonas sp. BN414]NWL76044.1 short-chain dehydrogenase [Pseudomonas taiwanensis]
MHTHKDRVAIVSGAAKGIGQELAIGLAQRGALLALLDIADLSETSRLVEEAGGQAIAVTCDVSREEDWDAAGELVRKEYGRCDILVNNAGIYPNVHIDNMDFNTWKRTFEINLDSMFFSAKVFVPMMRENKWGRIVNISSTSIVTNATGVSHYMATKMGIIGFTRGLANDLGNDFITVNAVAPALTATPGTGHLPDAVRDGIVNLQAFKRMAVPRDIVGPILFLTGEDAQFMTGQLLAVDGGMMKVG